MSYDNAMRGNFAVQTATSNLVFTINTNSGDANLVGNIVIGGQARASTTLAAGDSVKQILVGYNAANNYGYITPIQQGTAFTGLAICQSGGSVGIGTTPGNTRANIGGDMRLNDNTLYIRSGADTNHYIAYDAFVDGPRFQAYTGFVFAATNPSMTMRWSSPGSWSGGGTLTWNADGSSNVRVLVSSLRNKTNIANIVATTDDIMKLQPVQYEDLCACECQGCETYRHHSPCSNRYTPNCCNPNSKTSYGLIAESIEKIGNLSSMVLYEPTDRSVDSRGKQPYSIKYHEIGVLALKLAQESQRQIQDLKAQVAALTDTVNKLSKKH